MGRTAENSEVRQRILATADRLFYKHGIRSVGIDRVIAEAQVAKMSLYKHFASKDDLVLAVLKYREDNITEFFRIAMDRRSQTKDQLSSFFDALKEWFESPDFRGCAFQNAAVEFADPSHAGMRVVRDYKREFQRFLTGLIEASMGEKFTAVAPAIGLLVEGAIVTALIQESSDSADVARDAASRLVAGAKRID